MFDRIGPVPNFFYDFIVFFTPTVGLVIGLSFGVTGSYWELEAAIVGLGATATIALFFLIFFASYEYGRMAETYSEYVVGRVLLLLSKTPLLSNPDFRLSMSEQVAALPIYHELLGLRKSSKWTIYFFAQFVNPQLGSDLIKRYAWEKLARSSCFTCFLLFSVSGGFHLFEMFAGNQLNDGIFEFGGWAFSCTMLTLYVVMMLDYYQRNCWNNDLLITTLPVLVANFESNAQNNKTEVTGNLDFGEQVGFTRRPGPESTDNLAESD